MSGAARLPALSQQILYVRIIVGLYSHAVIGPAVHVVELLVFMNVSLLLLILVCKRNYHINLVVDEWYK